MNIYSMSPDTQTSILHGEYDADYLQPAPLPPSKRFLTNGFSRGAYDTFATNDISKSGIRLGTMLVVD
jgi:hypothetical protein